MEGESSYCIYSTIVYYTTVFVVQLSEEEAAEVKKSKLYRPASKFNSPPQNASPVQPTEVKKAVSELLSTVIR